VKLSIGFSLLTLSLLLGGCTRISPGHVGIVVNSSGSQRGVEDYPATTGRVWYNPANTDVLEYPTFVQTAVWSHNPNEGHPTNEEITFTTRDSMQVSADISIAYQLESGKVPNFYVRFRSADIDNFTHGFMRNLAREKFDNAAGHYSIEQIMGDNATFLKEARDALQKELTPVGVDIQQFGFIGAPRPPQQVIEAINLKVQATQIALQKQIEITQAEADAKKRIADADGYAKAGLIRAEAEAMANRKIAESLTPTLVQYKQLDKWDGKLPQVQSGSGSGVLFNIGK
jgi:regulator of protease activity HflC (stomatin/prohibitin superfamily)